MMLENAFDKEKYRIPFFKIVSGLAINCQRKHMVYLIWELLLLNSKTNKTPNNPVFIDK